MKFKVFSIYDAKAKAFQTPFYMVELGQALRAFEDLCKDTDTLVYRHPEDFQLYEIGSYDDSNAKHESYIPLELVSTATEMKTFKRVKSAEIKTEQLVTETIGGK